MGAVSTIIILFFFQKNVNLPDRKRLKQFLSGFFQQAGKTSGEIRIIFCSDEELLTMNQHHLKHDYYTDIITFPFNDLNEPIIEAELYISIDRVKDNAAYNQVTFLHELHRVIFHGCLHLIGLGDKSEEEQRFMKQEEDLLLNKYFVSRGT